MRIVLDCRGADYASVAGLECLKFAYLNGPGAWTAAQLDEQTTRGELLGVIDVEGNIPQKAAILDWTAMTPKDPDRLAWWVRTRNELAGDAVVLCIRDALPAVIGVLAGSGQYSRVLVTDLTSSGEPPLQAPQYGLPPNVHFLGAQYVQAPTSGGPYSLSILFDDTWQADRFGPGAAAALHATAAPAVPVISPIEAQAADAVQAAGFGPPGPSGSGTADLAAFQAAADPSSSPVGTTSFASLSAPPPGPPPVNTRTSPDAIVSSSPAVAAAAADTGAPGGTDDSHETSLPAPITSGRPFVPAAAVVQGAIVAAAPINHGYVAAWIDDGRKIAEAFRGARAGHVAAYLEDALAQLLEVGQLLSELGR